MVGKLTAKQVQNLTQPGRYGDGGNLFLFSSPNGGKRWTFKYRLHSRRPELGLGSAQANGVSLQEARKLADKARAFLRDGIDPMMKMGKIARAAANKTVPTFGEFADRYILLQQTKFRNQKHIEQWRMTLGEQYCHHLRAIPIDRVIKEDVLKVLKPIWNEKKETASRLRGRVENVLNAAKAEGLREGENPAAWKGNLSYLLPAHQKLTRGHHTALPYDELAAFMAKLRQKTNLAAIALEVTILTATRTSEVLKAQWNEFDLAKGIWIIPSNRMKGGIAHRVSLSARVTELLKGLPRLEGQPHVFPGLKSGSHLSGMAMLIQLRRMGRDDITVHGFRSTFRDWAAEQTSFPSETCEHALAHKISDRAEAAYRRGDQFEKRRDLMEDWSVFTFGGKAQ